MAELRHPGSCRPAAGEDGRSSTGLTVVCEGAEPLKIRLPYPPSANVCWRNVAGRTLLSREYRQYKEQAKWRCLQQLGRVKPMGGELVVSLTLFRPRRIGDIDNRVKPVLDSLQGLLFEDDSQVCELHVLRLDDKEDPRVEILVCPFKPHD